MEENNKAYPILSYVLTSIQVYMYHNSCLDWGVQQIIEQQYSISYLQKIHESTFFSEELNQHIYQSQAQAISVGSLVSLIMVTMFCSYLKAIPEPDDMEDKMKTAKEEISKKYKFFWQISQPGAKFLFGDKVLFTY